jgi:uncharacterized phage protein gp47/JayE
MVIRKKTFEQMNQESVEHLARSSIITALTPGSTARALVEATNRQIADLYDLIEGAVSQAYISLASGAHLDLLGQTLGVTRRTEETALVQVDDRNLRFYVETGTIGQRLPHPSDGTKGQIPSATRITSRDGTAIFVLQDAFDFPIGAREVFVTARATTTGTQGNVGRWELDSHNLGVTGVFVRNEDSIAVGRDPELDNSYRVRISNQVLAAPGANETAIRMSLLSIPGVADVFLSPGAAGAGSIKALLIPQTNRVPIQTLERVRRQIVSTAAYGISVIVEEPDYVPISMTIRLTGVATSAVSTTAMGAGVETQIRLYLGDLRPGTTLNINRLRLAALQAHADIEDASIIELCINRRPVMLQNWTLNEEQVFIPDDRFDDPIKVV